MPTGDLKLNSTSYSLAQGNGKQWCNGDCDWIDGQCKGGYEEKFANFYSSDNYVKDETTNLMMAPTTEETCRDNEGFSCQVGLLYCVC